MALTIATLPLRYAPIIPATPNILDGLNTSDDYLFSHYKSAVRYLEKDPTDIAATGGTNWQKYLPPRFQKRIFYPFLWTEQQMEEWGKGWVLSVLQTLRNEAKS